MRFLFLIPGTGHFLCGSCLRDNDLASALRDAGHEVLVWPLYLPLHLEEPAAEGPIHLGGINLYLTHKLGGRPLPSWLATRLDGPRLLRWAARRGDMTNAARLGDMTLAMLRGEDGSTRAELEKLARDLTRLARVERPDVVVLSNAMLVSLAAAVRRATGAPVLCTLQGEAPFLDALPDGARERAWDEIRARARDVDLFVAVSATYGDLVRERLGLDPERVRVVWNGIDPGLYPDPAPGAAGGAPPVIGYLARMCPDKGLHTLVDAFCLLEERGRRHGARLRVMGVRLAADRPFVRAQRARLAERGLGAQASFHPNGTRDEKLAHLLGLDVFSVPATYGESFGLPVLEALASGVPVVQPRHGAFPEVLAATGGGLLCEPDDPVSLADALEGLLADPEGRRSLGRAGRAAVLERFTTARMADDVLRLATALAHGRSARPRKS